MTNVDTEFVAFSEKEMTTCVKRYAKQMDESRASQVAKEIVKLIDWGNSALMHKGISWIAKNYLLQQKMI